jgi:cobalt/nickel transport system permease protein
MPPSENAQHPLADIPGTHAPAGDAVPAWLLEPPVASRAADTRRSFLGRFAGGLGHFVERAFAAEATSAQPGLLQHVDPRVKLLTLLGLVIVTVLVGRLPSLAVLLAFAVALVVASRIPLRRFAVRAWLFVPLVTAAVVLPAMTSWVTPGDALITLWRDQRIAIGPWHLPQTLAITGAGVTTAARIVLRVSVTVSFSVLLALTTRWNDLLAALRAVRVPRLFVFVLAIAYRYVFVLLRAAQDLVMARRSRTVGRVSAAEDRRFAGAAAGALFGKSQAMSEEIYGAMVARGYTGEARSLDQWRLRSIDLYWALTAAFVAAAVIALDLVLGRVV